MTENVTEGFSMTQANRRIDLNQKHIPFVLKKRGENEKPYLERNKHFLHMITNNAISTFGIMKMSLRKIFFGVSKWIAEWLMVHIN